MNGVTSLVLLPLFSGPAYDAVGGSPAAVVAWPLSSSGAVGIG